MSVLCVFVSLSRSLFLSLCALQAAAKSGIVKLESPTTTRKNKKNDTHNIVRMPLMLIDGHPLSIIHGSVSLYTLNTHHSLPSAEKKKYCCTRIIALPALIILAKVCRRKKTEEAKYPIRQKYVYCAHNDNYKIQFFLSFVSCSSVFCWNCCWPCMYISLTHSLTHLHSLCVAALSIRSEEAYCASSSSSLRYFCVSHIVHIFAVCMRNFNVIIIL